MISTSRRAFYTFALPILSVGLALLFTLWLQPLMALGYSILFLAAVMISAWYGGLRGGLIATSLAIVCLSYFFISPTYSIWISELNGLAWLVLFIVVSTLISSLNEARYRAEARLKVANQELESRVAERTAELTSRNEELQGALTRIRVLSGLLPVCLQCKKIRDNSGQWNEFESYISEHSDATFSQGICPECAKSVYPQYPFVDIDRKDER